MNSYEFECEGTKYAIFNHCWKVMFSIIEKNLRIYKLKICYMINLYKKINTKTKIIVYFHGNFDLEKLAFPAHIIIARKWS